MKKFLTTLSIILSFAISESFSQVPLVGYTIKGILDFELNQMNERLQIRYTKTKGYTILSLIDSSELGYEAGHYYFKAGSNVNQFFEYTTNDKMAAELIIDRNNKYEEVVKKGYEWINKKYNYRERYFEREYDLFYKKPVYVFDSRFL